MQCSGAEDVGGTPEARTVLVVDDDEATRETLQVYLETRGYRVVCAMDGHDALGRLASSVTTSLIILDLKMPVMDGRTFLGRRALDARLAAIPVIVMSADDDRHQLKGQHGVVAIVGKPCDVRQLERLVSAVLKSRRAAS
jgi:CheY-like chemotaxis protein